jgi:hypothetical protein
MSSKPVPVTTLTRGQHLQILGMQLLFFFVGLFFLVIGAARMALWYGGGLMEKMARTLVDEAFITNETIVAAIIFMFAGYGLIWGMAALGAKEPPAWHVGRNGLIAIDILLGVMAGFLLWKKPTWGWYALIAWVLIGGLSTYWLVRFMHLDFRLALGAERLRRGTIKVFTLRNIAVVLVLSSLSVLGVVYLILTDVIELPVPDTEPNELLFITDFENYNDEWDLYGGRLVSEIIEEENGNQRLVITVDSGINNDGSFSLLNRKFRDFDMRVTTTQLQSPENHNNRYGVLFRSRDLKNYYMFQISGDGYYQLIKVENGEADTVSTWISTTDTSDFDAVVYPTLIRPGELNFITNPLDATNEIRIIAKGDKFWFYVNGQRLKLCQKGESRESTYYAGECLSDELTDYYQDDHFKQGRIGLGVGYSESEVETPISVAFDNLLIIGPSTPQD